MNADIATKWLAALRSGEYKKGRGKLRSKDNCYCCLGVLCDVLVKEGIGEWKKYFRYYYKYKYDSKDALLPCSIKDKLNVSANVGLIYNNRYTNLIYLNDTRRLTFKQIANAIERNLKNNTLK